MAKILALNIAQESTDQQFQKLLEERAPDHQIDVANVHNSSLPELFALGKKALQDDDTLLSSGSYLNTLTDDPDRPFNAESESVRKIVNLFTLLLIMTRKGAIDSSKIKALLICFSAQAFSIALAIVDNLHDDELEKIQDPDDLLQSPFEAGRFWADPQHQANFPICQLTDFRFGEFPLKSGQPEVFLHTQGISVDKIERLRSKPLIEDKTDNIIIELRIYTFRAVQFHPDMAMSDLSERLQRMPVNNPLKTLMARALAINPDGRPPTLSRYL